MRLKVRAVTEKDYDALQPLYSEFDDLHASAIPRLYRKPPGVPRDHRYFEWIRSHQAGYFMLAEADREVVGCAHVSLGSTSNAPIYVPLRTATIDHIIVKRSFRRQGIGSALVREIEQWAKNKGADLLQFHVYAFNDDAIRFYRHHGFVDESFKMHKVLME